EIAPHAFASARGCPFWWPLPCRERSIDSSSARHVLMSWNGRGADLVSRRSHECRRSRMGGARLGASTLGIASAVPSCHGRGYIPIEPLIQTQRCPPLLQPHLV